MDGRGGEGERRGREKDGKGRGLCSSNISFKKPCDLQQSSWFDLGSSPVKGHVTRPWSIETLR